METPEEIEEVPKEIEEIPEENTKEKRLKRALTEKQRLSSIKNITRAVQVNKEKSEIKRYYIEEEKKKKEMERLSKLEEVRALKASKAVKEDAKDTITIKDDIVEEKAKKTKKTASYC